MRILQLGLRHVRNNPQEIYFLNVNELPLFYDFVVNELFFEKVVFCSLIFG